MDAAPAVDVRAGRVEGVGGVARPSNRLAREKGKLLVEYTLLESPVTEGSSPVWEMNSVLKVPAERNRGV